MFCRRGISRTLYEWEAQRAATPGLPIPQKGKEKLLFQRATARDKTRAPVQPVVPAGGCTQGLSPGLSRSRAPVPAGRNWLVISAARGAGLPGGGAASAGRESSAGRDAQGAPLTPSASPWLGPAAPGSSRGRRLAAHRPLMGAGAAARSGLLPRPLCPSVRAPVGRSVPPRPRAGRPPGAPPGLTLAHWRGRK